LTNNYHQNCTTVLRFSIEEARWKLNKA